MAATSQNKTKFEDYDGFVEKFKPKLTTDDCYTPANVYDAVADWVANEYNLDKSRFVRPFFPGGDYESYDYSGKIVVDNPPFSFLSKIVSFYCERDIPFFLFAPSLCSIQRCADLCTALICDVKITYANGAKVSTSFLTNLEPHENRLRVAPSLRAAVDVANAFNQAQATKNLPKYEYPLGLLTVASLHPLARYGIDFIVPRSESVRVSALDSQRAVKKQVFGCGWLISERLQAEREKAEREKAERWALSEREKEIIKNLGKENHDDKM